MTLIDYAKYLLNVCGRRFTHLYRRHYLESTPALPSLSALLSYLRTQTASIFTQIKARGAVHPLSGLPTTETLATLPTALSTLSTRKVDVGNKISTTDNLPEVSDGECLPPLFGDSTKRSRITEIIDRTTGWTLNTILTSIFPNATKISLGCTSIPNGQVMLNQSNCELHLTALETTNPVQDGNDYPTFLTREIHLDNFKSGWYRLAGSSAYGNGVTKKLYIGCKGNRNETISIYNYHYSRDGTYGVAIEHIVVREGSRQPINIGWASNVYAPSWTAQAIVDDIFNNLADNNYEDDGVTPAQPIYIYLGVNIKSKLSAAQIAVATTKNYIVQ